MLLFKILHHNCKVNITLDSFDAQIEASQSEFDMCKYLSLIDK